MGTIIRRVTTESITYEEHKKWFKHILIQDNTRQYIYMYDEEPVGQIRITISGEEAEIDYSICFEKRCMGYEKKMVRLLEERVKQDFPQVRKLVAKAKPDNIALQKVFLDMGYIKKNNFYEMEVDNIKNVPVALENSVPGAILFLTNNVNAIELYDWLKKRHRVYIYSNCLYINQIQVLQPSFIISYNYNYIIGDDIIRYMNGNIINLHISYLPWNRGSSPNIWSFIDDTPKGVTIHQVSTGLDKGKILYQKKCCFDVEEETFETSYNKLNQTIVELFKEKWAEIESGRYELHEQSGKGSYHAKKDLDKLKERLAFDWNDNVAEFLERYKRMKS